MHISTARVVPALIAVQARPMVARPRIAFEPHIAVGTPISLVGEMQANWMVAMSRDRGSALETKRAMFWAALVAEYTDEQHVTIRRMIAALLRAPSSRDFLSRMQIDADLLFEAIDGPTVISFRQSEAAITKRLAEEGVDLGSPEQEAIVQLRPIDPSIQVVFNKVIARSGQIEAVPLEILEHLLDMESNLTSILAGQGLTSRAIRSFLSEESS